jgi:hypothetical protein
MNSFAILLFAFACCGPAGASENVQLIGHYSNMKVSHDADPHIVSGHAISLYRTGDEIFGELEAGIGATEAASGRLYDIKFNPATKAISFKGRYLGGREFRKGLPPEGRSRRVLLIFSGKLSRNRLAGMLQLRDGYEDGKAIKSLETVLKRSSIKYTPKSYEVWAAEQTTNPAW